MIGGIRADQSISFTDMQQKLTRIANIVRHDPAVATVVAFTGGSRAGGGFMFITLKPRSQRLGAQQVIARLRPKLGRVSGVSLFLNPVQDLQVGGRQTTSTYQYVLEANDPDVLKASGEKLVEALKKHPNVVTDVDIDQQDAGADAFVEVNRDTAARLGVPMQTLEFNALRRFWPTPGREHLLRSQPISCGDGGRASVQWFARLLEQYLRPRLTSRRKQ